MPSSQQETAYRLERCQALRMLHYAQAKARLHPEMAIAWQEIGPAWAVYAGPDSPINRAKGLGLSGEPDLAALDAVEAFYQAHGARPAIDVCPLADEWLLVALAERGYRLVQFFTILVCPLPVAKQPPAPGVEIVPAGVEQAEQWIELTGAGYSEGQPPDAGLRDMLWPNFHAPQATPYLAYLDGQLAGGGGLYSAGDTVELGGTSVLPTCRRRGVQSALIQRRLADAYTQGAGLAITRTSPGSPSQHNLERLGFRVAYSKAVLRL